MKGLGFRVRASQGFASIALDASLYGDGGFTESRKVFLYNGAFAGCYRVLCGVGRIL